MTITECRICLVNNVTMHSIKSTKYPDLFEKLTGSKLIIDDGMPETICNMCFISLERFDKFFNMAVNAEQFLTKRLFEGAEASQVSCEDVVCVNLSKSTKCASSPEADPMDEVTEVAVKVEPMDDDELELVTEENGGAQPKSDAKSPIHILATPDMYPSEEFENIPPDIQKHDLDSSDDKENLKRLTDVANQIPINKLMKSNTAEQTANKDSIESKCKICTFKCANENELATHVAHDHDYALSLDKNCEPSVHCPICMKPFRSKISLKVHSRLHTGQQPYSCANCDRVFNQKQNLQFHMRLHKRIEQFTCRICRKKIPLKSDYNRHMLIHGVNVYDLKSKEKKSKIKSPYRSKMAAHRRSAGCNICGKKFVKRYYLNQHLRLHTGEQPFSCGNCERVFNSKHNWLTHLRTHDKKKRFACETCFKEFPLKQDMKRHMARHGEEEVIFERDFGVFQQKHLCTLHLRYHTGQLTPYPCDMCTDNLSCNE